MKIILITIGAIVLAIAAFLIYRIFASRAEAEKFAEYKSSALEPIAKKLQNNEELTSKEIEDFSSNPSTRGNFYYLLIEFQKESLLPKEFYTHEKAAESNLVNWLEYPTELDGTPDQIELVKTVPIQEDGDQLDYYVFKFRINEPHWAAKDGWMIGVAGPSLSGSKPYDHLPGTFSRLSKLDSISPEEEVAWVHKNITVRN